MERVLGIGGVFFNARDPQALAAWYRELLSAVVADLADDAPKLVYADWLEEQGDDRSDFLRASARSTSGGDPTPSKRSRHLAMLKNAAGCRLHIQLSQKDLAARNFE